MALYGLLGFAAGLPFYMFSTVLALRLQAHGVALAVIGFFAWVQLLPTLKFVWAPLLDRYAECIGLAFQVQDDILDGTGTAAALGKAPGADAARDKPTFLSLMGERASADYAQALCERAVQALAPFGERAQPLADIARFIVARDR
jgi:hypothetical protein